MQFQLSKCYEIVTEESAKVGDAEERGYVFEDEVFNFKELIHELQNYSGLSSSDLNHWTTWAYSEGNVDYLTGNTTSFSLHINKINNQQPSVHQLRRIYKTAGLFKSNKH